jgi:N4-gp56 family major capsid protein
MATSAYPVGHPLAVKLWSKKIFVEALKQTWLAKFMGKSDSSIIQIKDELSKEKGDRIRVPLRMQLVGNGISGDATLEGNEEALVTYYDDLLINQIRHAVRSDGKMSEQRVPFEIREHARMGLQDWFSGRIDTALFNQLGGNTGQADTGFTGSNATIAPSSGNIIYAGGNSTEAAVASASASNKMTLTYLDYAVEKAKTMTPYMRPVMVDGEECYVCFLHPYQVTDLRTSTSTGQWLDIQKAAMAGMQSSKSGIFSGALGMYNNVILHQSVRVPTVTAGCYRAIFCGAQAGIVGFGREYDSESAIKWQEKTFDFGNQLGVAASLIWGAKKTSFAINGTAADFGTIVIATSGAAHPN